MGAVKLISTRRFLSFPRFSPATHPLFFIPSLIKEKRRDVRLDCCNPMVACLISLPCRPCIALLRLGEILHLFSSLMILTSAIYSRGESSDLSLNHCEIFEVLRVLFTTYFCRAIMRANLLELLCLTSSCFYFSIRNMLENFLRYFLICTASSAFHSALSKFLHLKPHRKYIQLTVHSFLFNSYKYAQATDPL